MPLVQRCQKPFLSRRLRNRVELAPDREAARRDPPRAGAGPGGRAGSGL